MTCPQCGAGVDAAARFCGSCGKRVGDGAAPSTPPVQKTGGQRIVIPGGATNKVAAGANASPSPAPAPGQPAAVRAPAVSQPMAPPVMSKPPVVAVAAGSAPAPAGSRPGGASPGVSTSKLGASSAAKDNFIGQVLNGKYLIETKLGQGGFGAVYKGRHTKVGREVAIKVLHPEMARDQNLLQRFQREGTVACNLRDAHTVTTYDFDQTTDGVLYIAMELLTGKSLHDIFYDEAPLSWRRVLRVLAQMCSSLGEAHRQGIVHRDIKPENVYLEERPGHSDYVKVLDFGIAKIIRGDIGGTGNAPQLTASGQTLGTLEYMSPEQLMGKQLDGRSDIYAMGVLAYELITGHLPFPDAQGPAELIGAQLKRIPPAPSAANPNGDIPPPVDAIVLRMLEKDRGKRYQDVDELAADLTPVLASNGQSTGPIAAITNSGITPAPVLAAPPVSTSVDKEKAVAASPRPYVLAPTTSESSASSGPSKIVLWALVAAILIAGALVGVYFGVIKKAQGQKVAPPPAAERR